VPSGLDLLVSYPESTVGCLKQETRAAVTILARSAAGALQSRRCDTCNTTPPRLWGRRAVFGHGDLDRLVTLGVSAPDGSAPATCAQRCSTGNWVGFSLCLGS
jgi:hypothetical protein